MTGITRNRLILIIIVAALTMASVITTIFSLKNGIFEVFPYLYILPIIIIAYISPRHGVYFSIVLGWIYLGLVYIYGPFDIKLYASSSAWFYIIVSLGVVLSAFSNEVVKERKYRDIFHNSLSGIFTFDRETRKVQEFNTRIASILGYGADELRDSDVTALWLSGEDLDAFLSRLEKEQQISDIEAVFQKKDGSPVRVQVTAALTKEQVVICSAADITERTQIRDALRESETQYRTLFDSAGDAIFIHGFDGSIYEANQVACLQTGHPRDELKGMHLQDLDAPAFAHISAAQVLALRQQGSSIFETVHRHRDGRQIPIEISSKAIKYHGKPAVISIVRNIADRKRAEAAVRDSERRYRMIGELIPFGIWMCDAKGEFTYLSDSFLQLVGMTLEECRKGGWLKRLAPEDIGRTQNDWKQCVATGCFWDYEYRIFDKKGNDHFVLSRGAPLRDETGRIVSWVGNHLDITERRRNEKRLEASLKEKEVIIKEVHHRVKNNMQVISGFLQLQSNYITDPDSIEKLNECQRRVKTMALVHEKLYQSKHLGFINAAEYIKSLVSDLMESYALRTDIDIQANVESVNINIDTAIPCGLIINELLTNALKYAFKDRLSGHITVDMHLGQDHRFTLVVSDDGTGLTDGFDIGSTATLGMQLVAVLVRQLGGEIGIESRNGATFTITFPEKF